MYTQSVNFVNNSQPLRNVATAPLRSNTDNNSTPLRNFQSFSAANSYGTPKTKDQLQKELNFSCQLAAYYQTKYEELKSQGNCCV